MLFLCYNFLIGSGSMLKQFKGIKWLNNIPYFLFFDLNSRKMEKMEASGFVNIIRTDIRKCNGYYDLLERSYVPCVNFDKELSLQASQCEDCKKLSSFELCIRCDGKICRNDNVVAKRFCYQRHIVYIALFGNDKYKVGTAANYRKYARILEQGAVASMFIAETEDGKVARKLEHIIAQFGFSLQVNSNYKINNLIIDQKREEIYEKFYLQFEKIKQQLPIIFHKYLIDPQINYYEKINDINMF